LAVRVIRYHEVVETILVEVRDKPAAGVVFGDLYAGSTVDLSIEIKVDRGVLLLGMSMS